ncbi:MAG: HEAT repeat domain-containing protein [bacterium]|nr:HEAT repeat domain-containing protein [bacterium]
MLDSWIEQLQSGDTEERRKAIIALGRTKDSDALPALAKAYRDDPDPDLRELARKAGVYIRQQNTADSGTARGQEAPGSPPSVQERLTLRTYAPEPKEDSSSASKPAVPVRGREYTVSASNRTRARSYVEAALTASLRGDKARAMKDLGQAITLDPNLINDTYFGSVAGEVTGVGGDEAVRMILDGGQRKQFVQEEVSKTRRNITEKQMAKAKESTLGGVGFEMAIYVAINVIFPILILIVTVELARNTLVGLAASEDPAMADLLDSPELAQFNALTTLSIGFLVVFSIGWSVAALISTVFQFVFVHFAARVLGGVGTFLHLLDVMLQFYNRYVPILYILVAAVVIIGVYTLASPLVFCMPIILVGFVFYFAFKTVAKVGEAYNFGTAMGCLSVFIATLAVTLINGAIGALIGNTALNVLSASLNAPL